MRGRRGSIRDAADAGNNLRVARGTEAAEGHSDEARRRFEDAIDGFDLARAPYEATAARLRLGEIFVSLRREELARKMFEAARAGATRLGAGRLAEAAAKALGSDGPGPVAAARQAAFDALSGLHAPTKAKRVRRELS